MTESAELRTPDILRLAPSEMLRTDRAQAFLTDNRSPQAQEGRDRWHQRFGGQGMIVAMLCSDARERSAFPADEIIDLSTIAASGPTEPYAHMLNYPRTRGFVNASHFDSDKWQPGTMLLGCGGLGAKAEIDQQATPAKKGLGKYIKDDVRDKDAVYNAIKNGAITALGTEKPILAGVHDHKYGVFTPVAYFQGNRTTSEIPMGELLDPSKYDPRRLYGSEDGTLQIPALEDSSLPDVFKDFLEKQREHIASLQEAYPKLPEILAEQNPHYLIITTEKIPARIRYPHVLGSPGSFFQIHIPRGKNEAGIQVDDKSIDRAVAQAEYPIDHARFSNLHTIIIETGDLGQSQKIADALSNATRNILADHDNTHPYDEHAHKQPDEDLNLPWLKTWLNNPQNQILLVQTASGKSTQITKLDID